MGDALKTPVKAAVIGAGAWGTTLARLLTQQGFSVRIWAYEREVVDAIRVKHENTRFLPGVCLPETVAPTGSLEQAIDQASLIVFAVPSHAARSVLHPLASLLTGETPLISVTKGIEEDTLLLMTQLMQETLLPAMHPSITVLSGPSFAAEVCKGLPTAVTLAGEDAELVRKLQSWLMTPAFRVYAATDLIGVQLGGALKNVMAIAAGIVDGLGLGHSARAALVTRGLAEMIRLGSAMGADPRTFYGLSGVGDLVLTCTGTLSRNHTVGVRLGQGETLERILADFHAVAEGVRTARAAWGLADKLQVEMPIVHEVCQVLFEGKLSRQSVADLMERAAKDEIGTYAR
ncbi:MAG: NAD(P)H-dependent glycerol-3-phosphate dehydrogenase [Nitrospiraceae bacterium]